jgi:predicted membrane metal-binding protein
MNEEKIERILKNIGQADIPPNAALIAERVSRNFDLALKIAQPKQWFLTPVRLVAAAAVVIFAFAAGRLSNSITQQSQPPEAAAYTQSISTYPGVDKNHESFWQQKAIAAMQPRPYTQNQHSQTALLNFYKQHLKEKHYD